MYERLLSSLAASHSCSTTPPPLNSTPQIIISFLASSITSPFRLPQSQPQPPRGLVSGSPKSARVRRPTVFLGSDSCTVTSALGFSKIFNLLQPPAPSTFSTPYTPSIRTDPSPASSACHHCSACTPVHKLPSPL